MFAAARRRRNPALASRSPDQPPGLDLDALAASLPAPEVPMGAKLASLSNGLAPVPQRLSVFDGMGDPAPADGPASLVRGLPDPKAESPGIFGAIGDFLSSDEGRAALLRSGAATMQGGLGAGITAGANFVDTRHREGEDARRFDEQQALRDRGVGVDEFNAATRADLGQSNLMALLMRDRETGRHNRNQEGNQRFSIATGERNNMRTNQTSRANNTDTNATSERNNVRSNTTTARGQDLDYQANTDNEAGRMTRHTTPSADTTLVQDRTDRRDAAGIGSRYRRQVTRVQQGSGGPERVTSDFPLPPAEAVAYLRANPASRQQFDDMYGPGAAAQVIGE